MHFEYKQGSVLNQKGIIAHACNVHATMGSGIALALATKWPRAEQVYQEKLEDIRIQVSPSRYARAALGTVSAVEVAEDVIVVNMVTQLLNNFFAQGSSPTSLDAIHSCLLILKQIWLDASTATYQPTINLPLICAVRGGVDWSITQAIIKSVFADTSAQIHVWILPHEYTRFKQVYPHWNLP